MKKLSFLLMLMTLLILGCTKDNLQVDARQDQFLETRNGNGQPTTKPFKTKVVVPVEALSEGSFVGFCNDEFGNIYIVNDDPVDIGTTITHLGKVSAEYAEACVRPYLQLDEEVFPPEIYGPFLSAIDAFPIPGITTQQDVIVAANGKDKLFITSTFTSRPDPDDKFNSILEGTFEITGGTGKFEDATGGGELSGFSSANFLAPIYPYIREYDGEITY